MLKLFDWLQEYSLGIFEHLSLRIATKIVLASILAWGLANFFTVSNEVHILKQQQSNRFAEKSTRLTDIIQTAEVALSLGHDDAADEESIYKGYDADLHNNLVDQYRLSYSLTLVPTKATHKKLTGTGWKKVSDFDRQLLEQISDSKDKQLLIDQFGNLVLIRVIRDPDRGFFLQLKLSTQSLGSVLNIKPPHFIRTETAPSQNHDKQITFKLPVNDELILIYSEPKISLMTEYQKNLSANGFLITCLILASVAASIIFFGLLSFYIARGFKESIRKQKSVIETVTSELSQSNNKSTYAENKLFATQLQINAERSFLSYMKKCALEAPLQPDILSVLENGKKEPPKLSIVRNHPDPKESTPVVNKDEDSIVLEKIDMIEALGEVLNCFEVCQFEKQLELDVIVAKDISTDILTNPIAMKLIFYNILHRIFSRSKNNGKLHIEFTKEDDLLNVSFLDDGVCLGIDHKSYFEDTTSLSSNMFSWKRVVSIAQSDGMIVEYEQISPTQFKTILEAHIRPISNKLEEDCNNVVPFIVKP